MSPRSSAASLAALLLLGLAACQTENTTSPDAAAEADRGQLAMRLPPEVVTATDPEADSIRVRIVPTTGADRTPVLRTWPLAAGELILPSLPAVRCSIQVLLVKTGTQGPVAQPVVSVATYQWASLLDILPGKTTQVEVLLLPVSGSLSLNVKVAGNLANVVPPTASPAAGTFPAAQTVTLSRPAGLAAGTIQYRIENPATGNANPWTTYTGPVSIPSTSTLFYRTISGTDTGLIATGTYTIAIPVSPSILLSFATPTATPPGWAGSVVANQGSTVSGAVLPGPFAGNAARIQHSLAPSAVGTWVTARFSVPTSNWPNFGGIQLGLQSDRPRQVRLVLVSSNPAYQTILNGGGGFGATVNINTTATIFNLNRASFVPLPWGPSMGSLTLDQILPTITGLDIAYGCSTGSSCTEAGFLFVDEIRFLP